jgi:hypothetical protein
MLGGLAIAAFVSARSRGGRPPRSAARLIPFVVDNGRTFG